MSDITLDGTAGPPVAMRRRGPSLADVARIAGVSSQTVSRVSNGSDRVDESTRERVVDAMRQVGYRPNGAARALRRGSFHSLGVIVFTLSSVGNTQTLSAIADAASAAGYSIALMPVAHPTPEAVSAAFTRLSEQAVDGIVFIIEAHLFDEARIVMPTRLPVVVVCSTERTDHPVFDADQTRGATLATRHLLELGHRTVHHLGGPPVEYSTTRREQAWRAELDRVGAPVPEVLHGDWSAESGYRLGLRLAQDATMTALFAANDQMALGALRAFHSLGIDVPGRVSVVGFDGTAESAHFWPPLTTVRQDFAELGQRSVATILEEIRTGRSEPGVDMVPTELMIRASTAPPAHAPR